MAKSAKGSQSVEIEVVSLDHGTLNLAVLGKTPFYCNRVSEKAKRTLLYPSPPMTKTQKATNMKHDPVEEFRNSPYLRREDEAGPTRIMMKATAFKGAIAQAAIDMPSQVAKTQINRLTFVADEYVPIWGLPRLNMDIVRSADIGRTPDVRTRARIDRWASLLKISYVQPMLNAISVTVLLQAAGLIVGVGDFRQEKGKGNFGQFEIVDQTDQRWLDIVAAGGTEAQDEALDNPVCSDAETEELLTWYHSEVLRRSNEPTPKRRMKRVEEEYAGTAQ